MHASVILKQFILPGLGIDNRFRLSAHCANEPDRQTPERNALNILAKHRCKIAIN